MEVNFTWQQACIDFKIDHDDSLPKKLAKYASVDFLRSGYYLSESKRHAKFLKRYRKSTNLDNVMVCVSEALRNYVPYTVAAITDFTDKHTNRSENHKSSIPNGFSISVAKIYSNVG